MKSNINKNNNSSIELHRYQNLITRPETSTATFRSRGNKFAAQGTLLQKIKEKNNRRDCTPVTLCKPNKHQFLNINLANKKYTQNTQSRIN
jgi:hypothetical protein